MKVYYYRIRIKNCKQDDWAKKEYDVIAKNENCICINDHYFTTINVDIKDKDRLLSTLNRVSITDFGRVVKSMSGEFTISLYATDNNDKKVETKINKKFTEFINKALAGYMFNSGFKISLSKKKEV